MPADLIILQRNLVTPEVFDAMTYFQGMGKPVAVDLDDAYPLLPWSNPAHAFWIENSSKRPINPIEMLENGLRQSNGLIAPNRLLLDDWKHVVKGHYLPNYAQSDWWTNLPDRKTLKTAHGMDGRIVLGWGGSVSHYDSWWGSGLMKAATEVTRRHPEVLWLVCGNDKRIFDQLPVSWGNKAWQPGVQPGDWPKIVRHFDIGLAPLFGPYDQRRSWIKGLEYLLGSVPWIGAEGEPYSDISSLGVLIPQTQEAWEEALENMLSRLVQEQEKSEMKVAIAQQWFIENQKETYERVYKEIISNYQARQAYLGGVNYVNWSSETRITNAVK